MPAFMGVAAAASARSPRCGRRAGIIAREQAERTAAATHEHHDDAAFARWGGLVAGQP